MFFKKGLNILNDLPI